MKKQDLQNKGKAFGLSNYEIDTLIMYHCSISKKEYFLLDILDNFQNILDDFQRISDGYPLEYITSVCDFYGREFYVDKRVLIPRIDTECMIQRIKNKNYQTPLQHIDIWTGSWIIPITLNLEGVICSSQYALDLSFDALEVCQKNLEKYNLEKSVFVYNHDLLSHFDALNLHRSPKTMITANLPYIKNNDHDNMWLSTIVHEPDIALYWWKCSWFEIYERLIMQCKKIAENWYSIDLFIEIWFDQANLAQLFLEKQQLDFEFYRDSATIQRGIEIHF